MTIRTNDLPREAGLRLSPDAARVLTWACIVLPWAIPVVLGLWSIYGTWSAWTPMIAGDQWADIDRYSGFVVRDGRLLHYLYMQHNEHRIAFPRLVFMADVRWFAGRNVLDLTVNWLIQLAGALLFFRIARPSVERPLRWLGLAAAVTLLVSISQWENFLWGFQVQFLGVFAAGGWAIHLFSQASADRERPRWLGVAGALLVLFLTVFTMANGVMAGLAMLMVGIIGRRGRAVLALLAAVELALCVAYFHGYEPVAGHSPPGYVLSHPLQYLQYVLIYLGNPFARASQFVALIAGAFGVAVTGAMSWVVVRERGAAPVRLALLGIILFIGMSAGLTGLGRLNFGLGQALSSRYATGACYFWAAQAIFWTLTAEESARPLVRRAVVGALLIGMLKLFADQRFDDAFMSAGREDLRVAADAMPMGSDDPQAIRGAYPNPAAIVPIIPLLKAQRLSVYAPDDSPALGSRLLDSYRPAASGACAGYFDSLTRAPAGGTAWRAKGWAWDRRGRLPIRRIALVDASGRVVGLGRDGDRRSDVAKALHNPLALYAGWVASVKQGASGELAAYGLTADRQACELSQTRPVAPPMGVKP